jgi:glycosyltransferase involved in cell wall biosynthesis
MLILFFSDFRYGGSQSIGVSVANELFKSKIPFAILALSNRGAMKYLLDKNIKIYNLKSERVVYSLFKTLYFFKNKSVKTIFCIQPHLAFLCLFLNLFIKKKIKIIARETNTSIFNNFRQKNFRVIFEIFLKKIFYKNLHTVIFSSNRLSNEYNCNKVIIPNFVVKKNINGLKKKKLNKIYKKNKFILSIGRLIPQKRFQDLIFAFNLIKKKIDQNLLIIGEGPEKEKLIKLIKNFKLQKRVKIIKFVSNPYKYLKNCSIFVLTSAWEGMPNILIQALFCSNKIVSTDCKYGPREILNNGAYGKLVKIGDYKKISLSILKIINQKKIKIKMKHLNRYDSTYIMPKYINILR